MSDTLSLYFQLKPGEKADLEVVAASAIAWVEGLRAAARAVDPEAELKVELVDADESSLILNAVVKWFETHLEQRLERFDRGGKRLPRTKKLAIALAPFILITGVPTYDFYFGEEPFTENDRAMLEAILEQTKNDPAVEAARRKFYRTVERDPSITGVGVKEAPSDKKPIAVVPSDQFAEAGGLWVSEDEDVVPTQTTYPVLDVVLVKPALVHTPRAWTFKPEGLPEFDAVMRDPAMLQAMKNGVPVGMKEGIPMTIRLEVKEVMVDGQWRLVRGGRSVQKVLSPKLD